MFDLTDEQNEELKKIALEKPKRRPLTRSKVKLTHTIKDNQITIAARVKAPLEDTGRIINDLIKLLEELKAHLQD